MVIKTVRTSAKALLIINASIIGIFVLYGIVLYGIAIFYYPNFFDKFPHFTFGLLIAPIVSMYSLGVSYSTRRNSYVEIDENGNYTIYRYVPNTNSWSYNPDNPSTFAYKAKYFVLKEDAEITRTFYDKVFGTCTIRFADPIFRGMIVPYGAESHIRLSLMDKFD